ncbi:AraC family transcriptional regulator [Pseudaminobacter soli (ex Li et al. 2025)]|uniref:AraC family transcriptional regulator n=1 Tax=Pseudaminobacter soli (ex Li et al. 2025) TaxID=1295366 RepID=A0A2P7S1X9_9HYPH|nr:AraC family transcriptional regulator [Mesorhizobium soli]PSJ56461.1 AraC family transcriptional regulator [Mesorhizobium soli]
MAAHSAVEAAKGRDFAGVARSLFGNVRLDFENGDEEKSRLKSAMLGNCRLTRLGADVHTVFGDRVAFGSDSPDAIKLIIQTHGRSSLHQNGRNAAVGGEGAVIYDPMRPYVLTNRTPVRLLLLQLPRRALPSSAVARLAEPFVAPPGHAGMQRILLSLMDSTIREIDQLDETACASVGQTMVELVRTMIGGDYHHERASVHSLDLLRRRIKDFIADNIARPDLGAALIARRLGCSVRYVYRAFEAEGMTPGDHIWNLRLEAAASRLRETQRRPGDISEIAFGLGFSSSAHFSRAFRGRYSLSPSEWRKMAG